MQRDAGISKYFAGALIPLCIWGMISSLVLHLVEVRSSFIAGEEWRLRIGVLSFALGIIMLQRIHRVLGRGAAMAYGIALWAAMTAFCAHQAWAYLLPAAPAIVFAINMAVFAVLWVMGHKITASCWTISPEELAAGGELGILARSRLKKEWIEEERRERPKRTGRAPVQSAQDAADWSQPLAVRHPGRVILYFALLAVPAFGAGTYLFDDNSPNSIILLGINIFVYLWCSVSLLYLTALSRLCLYFEKRSVDFPDRVGMPWLAGGFVLVTFAVLAAFVLPQPPSMAGMFVRERIHAGYRGWSVRGGKTQSRPDGRGGMKEARLDRSRVQEILEKRYEGVDSLNDPYMSQVHRETALEQRYQNVLKGSATVNEVFGSVFDVFIKGIYILLGICGVIFVYVVIASFARGLGRRIETARAKKSKKRARVYKKRRKRAVPGEEAPRRFEQFQNPFEGEAVRRGHALVRYLWEALLAWCADQGDVCPPSRTPLEFVESGPESLTGFEKTSAWLAELFTYCEFSGRDLPDDEAPRLERFWHDLQRFSGRR